MTLKSLQAELAKLQKRGQLLESQIKTRAAKQYATLPGRVGLKSVDQLIHALVPHSSPRFRGQWAKGSAAGSSSSTAAAPTAARRRGRPPKSASAQPAAAPAAAPKAAKTSKASKAGKSSTRNRYSETVKAAIRRDLEKGGKTFNQLSKEYGPSVFSIKDWKKGWGLTKARKKRK